MAIPGLRPSFEVRAKVRVGEKGRTTKGVEYPKSTDHFLSEDADFQRVCGDKPKELTILLPFEKPEDNFSTGLEQWQGAMLVCYAKGDTRDGKPVAFRKATMKKGGRDIDLLAGFEVVGETMGNDRRPVVCPVRECAILKAGDCKPMGRLQFFIKGIAPENGVYQLDTKSWNTIEKIEAFLSVLGDPRGVELTLRVEMWSKGTSKFPVITLEGGSNVKVNSEADVALADSFVQLHKYLAHYAEDGEKDDSLVKAHLAASLDLSNPGWRENPEFIDRIKEIGAVEAAKGLLKRYEL